MNFRLITWLKAIKYRLKAIANRISNTVKKFVAKLIYSLPIIYRANPRNKLTTFKDWCTEVESFPASEEMMSKDWYLPIRPSETIQRRLPIGLNEDETALFKDSYEEDTIPEVFLSCIHKAKIFSKDFIVLSPENYIFSNSLWEGYDMEANGILDTIMFPPVRYYSGNYCVLGTRHSDNYYHWMFDILPRLSLIEQEEELRSIPLILPKTLKAFQKESLQLAGVSSERIVGFDGDCWQVDKLYFPSLINNSTSTHIVSWLRSRFLDHNDYFQQSSSPIYLYLTRRDASSRRVLEEDKIIEFLKDLGFKIICASELSFVEQIQTFSKAKIIIAPHGAGLTNIVFAPKNSVLIELFPKNNINGCYWAIAEVCGHRYTFLTGDPEGKDFHISLDKLKALLDKVVVDIVR